MSEKRRKLPNSTFLDETFYYDHKKLVYFVVFNVCLNLLIGAFLRYIYNENLLTSNISLFLAIIVEVFAILALIGSLFVAIHPLRVAHITKEDITIDHNQPLKWEDIEEAQKRCFVCLYPLEVIALIVKKDVKYKLTFMQKICQYKEFTAFSIPLYAMTPKDVEKIKNIIKEKCGYDDK